MTVQEMVNIIERNNVNKSAKVCLYPDEVWEESNYKSLEINNIYYSKKNNIVLLNLYDDNSYTRKLNIEDLEKID